MLDNDAVMKIILGAMESLNEERADDQKVIVSPDTPLFGADADVDSLALVSIIADVEMGVSDALGHVISLTDDRAISQAVSPFSNPRTLAAYIVTLASEER